MTASREPATRPPDLLRPLLAAPDPGPRSTGARARRAVPAVARWLLVRALVLVAFVAAAGGLFARYRGGVVTAPVAVAPGIVGEQGSGAWLYALRLGGTFALVDAGRDVKGRPIDAALAALGARRADVTDVLVTHGHPSETMGLAAVRAARVHAGEGDVDLIAGHERPGRGFDRIAGMVLPRMTAQVADPIRAEEAIEIGGERILALPVPGHSRGSTAYLVRGVLFVGDAAAVHAGRLVPGTRFLSEDPVRAERALVRLARRLAAEPIERICSAHTGCSEPGSAPALLQEAAARPVPR